MSKSPFRYFKTSPEIIQLAVRLYVRFPLSLRNVEDLLHERGIDICHESIRLWVDRFGTHFAGKIRKQKANYMRQVTQWQWHLDEVFVKINGVQHYPAMKEIGNRDRQEVGHHINRRQIFKTNRDAALFQWRELIAA